MENFLFTKNEKNKDILYWIRSAHYYILRFCIAIGDRVGSFFMYQKNPPPVKDFIRDIPYGNKDKRQKLDIIVPKGDGPFPVLIYIHGGGWLGGDKYHYTRIVKQLSQGGTLVFNVNYPLAPDCRFPSQFQNISLAIGWILKNAEKYGGDVNKIFLAGDSAGAHLSSWYAAAACKPELFEKTGVKNSLPLKSIKGLLLFFGVYDLETACNTEFFGMRTAVEGFIGLERDNYREIVDLSSPLRHISENYPPVFLCCGEVDKLYPQSVDFRKVLESKNVPLKPLLLDKDTYPRAFHAFLYRYYRKCAKVTIKEALDFIKKPV